MKDSGRIGRLWLAAACLARALVKGKANHIPTQVSKIIVVPTGKLGDVVCVTPVLRAVRTYLPEARLIVAGTSKLHRPLLADSGLADEYLDLEEPRAIARVRESGAKAALITGPSFVSTALLFLAGVPLVVAPVVRGGFSPAETCLYRIIRRLVCTFPYEIDQYAPQERLKVLEPLGISTNDTKKQLGFSQAASKKIEQLFIDHGIDRNKNLVVGISLSAGNKIKEWPVERFAEVIDHLAHKYQAKVLIIGDKTDVVKAEALYGYLKEETEVLDTTGKFNLDELKTLISKLKLFISVDTGPIYIAEAFSIPTVNIVGPVDERVQPPRGRIHRNVLPPGRTRAELSILNARIYNREEARRQVLSISASLVTEVIDQLLADIFPQQNGV